MSGRWRAAASSAWRPVVAVDDGVAFVLEPLAISPTSGSESSTTSTRTGVRALGGGGATISPDAITFLALVERAGVFVTGEHRIGATAWTLVHI